MVQGKLKLGSGHFEFLNRIKLYGSACAVNGNEIRMVRTTLTRMGLVTFELVGERTLKVKLTEAGESAVAERGDLVREGGGSLGDGCRRHFPARNA